MARVRRYQRKSSIQPNKVVAGVALGLTILALFLGRHAMVDAFMKASPVRFVRIEGSFEGLEPSQFEAAIKPEIQGSYLTTNLSKLEAVASEVPWVGGVTVSRIWPDTLVFQIDELDPVGRWGEHQLISSQGEVFNRPATKVDFEHLPKLQGPLGREKTVLAMREQLDRKFAVNGSHLVKLSLSERLAWSATLSNGLEIAYGNQSPLEATDRLLEWLPQLQAQHQAEIKTVDLRYPRGFAISWKAAPATAVTVPGGHG
jgi:cell division protein FtsQ